MSTSSSNILTKLQKLNKKKGPVVFLPSLNKKVKFLPFTLRQQKNILAAMPEDASQVITFNKLFNNIIAENCDDGVDVNSLNQFDRLAIVLAYRATSLGDTLDTEEGDVNIDDVIKKVTSYKYGKLFDTKNITNREITAEVSVPTIEYEEKINDAVSKLINKDTPTNTIVSELYISEILKFIKSIKIEKESISLIEMSYDEKIQLIEALPGNFVKLIMKFIEEVKKVETEVTTVDGVKLDVSNQLFS